MLDSPAAWHESMFQIINFLEVLAPPFVKSCEPRGLLKGWHTEAKDEVEKKKSEPPAEYKRRGSR